MEARTILVAEDNEDEVILLQRAFRKSGMAGSLQFVPDGDEALDYLRGKDAYANRQTFPIPAFLLLDLKMPKKGGLEVLTEIRADPVLKPLVVVLLTSSEDTRDIKRALELGANAYLVKPSTIESLITLLQRLDAYWLGRKQTCPSGNASKQFEFHNLSGVF